MTQAHPTINITLILAYKISTQPRDFQDFKSLLFINIWISVGLRYVVDREDCWKKVKRTDLLRFILYFSQYRFINFINVVRRKDKPNFLRNLPCILPKLPIQRERERNSRNWDDKKFLSDISSCSEKKLYVCTFSSRQCLS